MLYRRRRVSGGIGSGFYRFESASGGIVFGSGDGDVIRLRDGEGNEWRGSAEATDAETVRYTFRDHRGRTLSGVSDHHGILLRDECGNVWRGYID